MMLNCIAHLRIILASLLTTCDNLKIWADTWQLQIASEKCLVHRVTNQNVHIEKTANLKSPYILYNNQLNWSKET